MAVPHPDCAGLDVHKDTVAASVRHMANGAVERKARTFKTTTKDLLALSEARRRALHPPRDGGDRRLLDGSRSGMS